MRKICSEFYSIDKINFNSETGLGTATLNLINPDPNKPNCKLILTWSILSFPMETEGMPGAPYPVIVEYNIFDEQHNVIGGKIAYEIASGTLPLYSPLGIPYGIYNSQTVLNKKKIVFSLNENSLKFIIS